MNEDTLFAAALERKDAAERAAFLDRACGGDAQLRQRIEDRLRGQEQSADSLAASETLNTTRLTQDNTPRRELVDLLRKNGAAESPLLASALANLGMNLLHQNKYGDAESILREGLDIRRKKQADDWLTFNTQSMRGASLLGQKQYADAEPLLLAGYEGMKARMDRIPPQGKVRLTEALERLVRLYEAKGQKDKAEEWRRKWETAKKESKSASADR